MARGLHRHEILGWKATWNQSGLGVIELKFYMIVAARLSCIVYYQISVCSVVGAGGLADQSFYSVVLSEAFTCVLRQRGSEGRAAKAIGERGWGNRARLEGLVSMYDSY